MHFDRKFLLGIISCFKRQNKVKSMVKFTDVYANPVLNGRLSKLDACLTLNWQPFFIELSSRPLVCAIILLL